jgi:hypothetical protein
MNDVTSIEVTQGDLRRPFYEYQKDGYFPWKASFEGRTVGEEITHIINKIPSIQVKDQEPLFDFFKFAMRLSARTYFDSFEPDKLKPVYHGTNPNAGTLEALDLKYCGHQEASSLFGASLYVGACIKGDLKYNASEFKALAFAALIHESEDWYTPRNLGEIFAEIDGFAQGENIPKTLLSFLLQVNQFGKWPEETIPKLLKTNIDALKSEGFEIRIKADKMGDKLDDYEGEGIRRLTILAGIMVAADWSQCVNDSYLTDSNGPRCLADEFNEIRPNAKLRHWYGEKYPSQPRFIAVGTDEKFYTDMILRGLNYCGDYLNFFYGDHDHSPLPAQKAKLETNVHIVEARKAIAPAFEEKKF